METGLDDIKEWLGGKGTIENIHMRKGPLKTFKVRFVSEDHTAMSCPPGIVRVHRWKVIGLFVR